MSWQNLRLDHWEDTNSKPGVHKLLTGISFLGGLMQVSGWSSENNHFVTVELAQCSLPGEHICPYTQGQECWQYVRPRFLDLPRGQQSKSNDLVFKTCEGPIFPWSSAKTLASLALLEIKWKALVFGMELETLLALAWAGQGAGRGKRSCPHPSQGAGSCAAGPYDLQNCQIQMQWQILRRCW